MFSLYHLYLVSQQRPATLISFYKKFLLCPVSPYQCVMTQAGGGVPGVAAIHSNLKQIHVHQNQKTGNSIIIDIFPVWYREGLLKIHVLKYLLGSRRGPAHRPSV